MNTLKGELASFQSLTDLKQILSSAGPCISVYMPLSTASTAGANPNLKQNELHWKELVRSLEDRIEVYGEAGRELLDSLQSWDAIAPEGEPQGKSIGVFRSPETCSVTWLLEEVGERAVIGPHFYVRPLLSQLTHPETFYLLALSQKNVRLLRCTSRTSEEVPLPQGIPVSFDAFMNSVKRDHNDRNSGSTGPSSGHNKTGALAPMGADKEAKDEFLSHFFRQIDRGINELLRNNSEPLVLAAVEYELPIYQEINSYPQLAAESVQGAPNGLKAGEMHARAIDALNKCYEHKVDEALAEWNHRVGGGASSRLKDVVTAAHDGRILTLLVSDSQELTGIFDDTTHTVKGRETGGPQDEDLINDAAVQTVLHAGKVLVAPHHKMPNGAPMAAIFRF